MKTGQNDTLKQLIILLLERKSDINNQCEKAILGGHIYTDPFTIILKYKVDINDQCEKAILGSPTYMDSFTIIFKYKVDTVYRILFCY